MNEEESRSGRRLHGVTVVVVIVGALLTAGLSWTAWSAHQGNEERLVEERVREAGAVLTSSLPGVEELLRSAAIVAEEQSSTDQSEVRAMLETQSGPEGRFAAVSMWDVNDLTAGPLWTLGTSPTPDTDLRAVHQFLENASAADEMLVFDRLDAAQPGLAYGISAGVGTRFVLFAEVPLPPNRTNAERSDETFADLDYALYLGDEVAADALLLSSTPDIPLSGRTASNEVDFGDTSLLLVMSPVKDLSGDLLGRLWLLVATAGLTMTASVAALTERVLRGRDGAAALAAENGQLYEAQRTVAEALQESLLPERLPEVKGIEIASRYRSGTTGLDVGGDWYDVIVHGSLCLFVVGDVSGRGVSAATTMGSLRHAFRAFASLGMDPAAILTQLNDLEFSERNGQFATMVCASIDLASNEMRVVSAGHPPLLIMTDGVATFARVPVQLPIGVAADTRYAATTVPLPGAGIVLGCTDGLFERRGETLDKGLERLQNAAIESEGTLEERMQFIIDTLIPDGAEDDTAMLGMMWAT